MNNIIQWGSEFIYDKIGKPCMICGKTSHYIEIFSEAHFCSQECLNKWDDKMTEYIRTHPMDDNDF